MMTTGNNELQSLAESLAFDPYALTPDQWASEAQQAIALTERGTIIKLKCESDAPSYDQSVREVEIERETDSAWFGRPVANPNCPVLEWPKFAWKEVE